MKKWYADERNEIDGSEADVMKMKAQHVLSGNVSGEDGWQGNTFANTVV